MLPIEVLVAFLPSHFLDEPQDASTDIPNNAINDNAIILFIFC